MTENDTTRDDDIVTPEEHAEAYESVELGQDVADDGVPADVEIAARSADMDSPSNEHEKIFVLGPNPHSPNKNPYTAANGFDHEPNLAATRQYAIDAGMWPTADARFKSAKKHDDGVSWVLTYTVPVIPAHDAEPGSQTPRVVGSDGADVPEDADDDNAAALASNATNYEPAPDADEKPAE